MSSRRVSIEFEGVYMNATVFIDTQELKTHAYGHPSFSSTCEVCPIDPFVGTATSR